MKKLNALAAMLISVAASQNTFAAGEETSYFSNLSSNWGDAYTTFFYASNGGIFFKDGNVHVNPLPYGLMDQGEIYSICCYNEKLYYSTGPEGSDISEPVKIYSCDMNGQNNRLLADNVSAWSDIYIVDNVLYYTAYSSRIGEGPQGYDGGIYRINLNDLSWKKLVSGGVYMEYCDGDYVYYTNYSTIYDAIDVNGNNVVNISPDSDEYQLGLFIKGNKVYYISDDYLYERDRNGGNPRRICIIPEYSEINNVTENYVYYSIIKKTVYIDHGNEASDYFAYANRENRW